MVDKLKNALNKGFESFDQRTKNLSDIKQLVERVRFNFRSVTWDCWL